MPLILVCCMIISGVFLPQTYTFAQEREKLPERPINPGDPAGPQAIITVTATSAALGVGWSWGKGTLTLLNGKQYHFKVSGLDVVAVGFKQATVAGNVYNLKNVKDFEGTYVAATASGTVGGGMGAASMRNDKGVVINLSGVGQGVDLRLAVSGMTVKLTK